LHLFCNFVFPDCYLRCELCRHHEQHAATMQHRCRHMTHAISLLILIYLLRGARCSHDLQCAPRPSHIAGNDIGDAGCIALSSSLVHLSHLEVLYLHSKIV
jgi:hypothetical protein